MKQFVDQSTGKKFQLGSRGYDQLLKRTMAYAEKQKEAGVSEVALAPKKLAEGDQFKCSACDHVFTFDGGDYDEFIEGIKIHGRAHGQCSITPVI